MSAALSCVFTQGPSISISLSLCRRCILQSHKYWNPFANKPRKLQVVRSNLQQFPDADAVADLLSHAPLAAQGFVNRAEGLLYTLADSAVATDAVDTIKKQNGDWFSGIANSLEGFLKVLKDGLEAVHIPYAYGFAIILLTILVKAATFPLTKQQVESTMAIQNLQPKIKAIQEKYAGNQEMIQLETAKLYKQVGVNPLAGCLPTLATIPVWIGLYRALSNVADEGLLTEGFFWIPSLAGPTTIAARQNGSGISWLFPFEYGHPPLGWSETLAYLVLPVLLIASQYISMQIMQPSQANDPNQKSTQAVLKFLPLMVGYFSLSVPSGLSLYWLTNNILSTGQQVWLRKLGGAKPPVRQDFDTTQSVEESTTPNSRLVAYTNKPSLSELVADPEKPVKFQLAADPNKPRRGERFKQLKEDESRRKKEREEAARKQAEANSKAVDVADDHTHSTRVGEKAPTANSLLGSDDACNEDKAKNNEQTSICSVKKDELTDLYVDNGNGSGATSVNSTQSRNKQSKQRGAA